MFRVLDVAADAVPQIFERDDRVALPPSGVLRWVDLEAQDDAQLQLLQQRFCFHPLTIEDCAHFDQRAKVEEYGEYLFIVTHGVECKEADASDLELHELHAFLGPGYLVTVHERPIPALTTVWKRCAGDAVVVRRGIDFVYYQLADAIVDM